MSPILDFHLRRRDDAGSTKSKLPIIALIGFGIAGVIVLALVAWVAVMFWRKRQKKKREDARGAAFITVKGVVKEGRESFWSATGNFPTDLQAIHNEQAQQLKRSNTATFSRANLTPSIVLPDKCIIRPGATREEIIAHHEAEGNLPRPFAPFSLAMAANSRLNALAPPSPKESIAAQSKAAATIGSIDSPGLTDKGSQYSPSSPTEAYNSRRARHHSTQRSSMFSALRDSVRDSFFTANSNSPGNSGPGGIRASARFSVASTASSSLSGVNQVRRVRQTFTPILPDEPLLTLGERVTVMQSFDDGWCVIGRDAPYSNEGKSGGEIELGTVPAWCFVKPMKGLRSERPIRSTSLGVTVQMEKWDVGPEKREDIISWSNF